MEKYIDLEKMELRDQDCVDMPIKIMRGNSYLRERSPLSHKYSQDQVFLAYDDEAHNSQNQNWLG